MAHRDRFAPLALGAIGVVFGDIGTSPLYAFREALGQAAATSITASDILGVLSLALCAHRGCRSCLRMELHHHSTSSING